MWPSCSCCFERCGFPSWVTRPFCCMRSIFLIQGNVFIAANVLLDLNLQGTWLVRFAQKSDLLYSYIIYSSHLPFLKPDSRPAGVVIMVTLLILRTSYGNCWTGRQVGQRTALLFLLPCFPWDLPFDHDNRCVSTSLTAEFGIQSVEAVLRACCLETRLLGRWVRFHMYRYILVHA